MSGLLGVLDGMAALLLYLLRGEAVEGSVD
jgi:hypothetical protein